MKKKKNRLQPLKIAKDCTQAAINHDSVAVIHSDQSLWLLHPFTSKMCQELCEKRRNRQEVYWDEKKYGSKPTFKKIMENVLMVSATANVIAVVKEDDTLWVYKHCRK